MKLQKGFSKKFPRNYFISHPLNGALLLALFFLIFALLYKPLGSHASRLFGYEVTMAAYALISAASFYGLTLLLCRIKYFSDIMEWTLGRELVAILFLLVGVGIFVYFFGFILEEPAKRWNISTLFNTVKRVFLIGILPFLFFTLMNYLRRIHPESDIGLGGGTNADTNTEELIHITSQLKKESLSFYPDRFIYAESESNYVNFFLQEGDKIKKKVIRNSISEIERQLSSVPFFIRTHRAFIVNLKMIRSKRGNSLGYRLLLKGIDAEIPVSRNNARTFIKLFKKHC